VEVAAGRQAVIDARVAAVGCRDGGDHGAAALEPALAAVAAGRRSLSPTGMHVAAGSVFQRRSPGRTLP